MKPMLKYILPAAALALTASPALADDWTFSVTPYLWVAGFDGDVKPFPNYPQVHADRTTGDVLDDFQVGGAVAFEGYSGNWSFLGDFTYANTDSGNKSVTTVNPPGIGAASFENKTTWLTGAVGYRVWASNTSAVDVYGGGRFNWVENEIQLYPSNGDPVLDGSHDENWVDPIVGVRGIMALSDQWSLTGMADIGGFGVGADMTYQLYAAANYSFNESIALILGYRYLSLDYDQNGTEMDIAQNGPIVGARFRF